MLVKQEFQATCEIMGPRPRISLENRGKVLALSEERYSKREIADRVDCSQRRFRDILKKQRLTGNVKDLKIPGRKRKTTKREDRVIVTKSKSSRYKTPLEINVDMQIEHSVSDSTSTIQRKLRKAGLNGRKPRKKPSLLLVTRRLA